MAVVSMPSLTQRITLTRLRETESPDIIASGSEIVPEPVPMPQPEEKIYVAVGKEIKECRMTLLWALRNSGGKKICLLYVLVPSQKIPMGDMGIELPVSAVTEERVREHREVERHSMQKLLDEYINICSQFGVRAEKLFIEKDSIEKGILELIGLHGIRKLVMGAASDRRNARKMVEPKSKKALYIRDEAPLSCHIWFTCNGLLIYTREGTAEAETQTSPAPLQICPILEPGPSYISRSESAPLHRIQPIKLTNPVQDIICRVFSTSSDRRGGRLLVSPPEHDPGVSGITQNMLDRLESFHNWDEVSRGSSSQGSAVSSSSSGPKVDVLLPSLPRSIQLNGISEQLSPPSVLDQSVDSNIYDQYERALTEADCSRIRVHEETMKREKAEKKLLEAVQRVKNLEILFNEERRRREVIGEALLKEEDGLQKLKNQRDEVGDELRAALDQKSQLESQISESEQTVWDYEQKIISAVELLQNLRQDRDNLQRERDSALREAEELRRGEGESSSTSSSLYFSEISFSEIMEATQNFNESLKIGEGGYGSIYKGCLRHTQVAIKILNTQSMQGPLEFQQEVDVLSKVRHPNLITLIGACTESWSLVYEYLPNGSLEDRLYCKDNTTPLSWQTRVRIASELCSALIFLHSCKPNSIAHGDVKPANILLDAHFVTKLGDFGISRLLNSNITTTTPLHRTNPKGTFAYIDPEFLSTGEITPKSDVYSFGVILLELLTGKKAIGISKEVRDAVDQGNLEALLDPLAGDWPFVQAEQLAHLALRCCDVNRKNRPDLGSEVWRTLESMRVFSGGSSSFQMEPTEKCQPPSYFICPILQEIMQDPQVAADGFTYEAEALKGWLESGHNTSPMTNLPLLHNNLVPNRALRSAIQEWLQNLNI